MNAQDKPDLNTLLDFDNPDPVTLNIVLKGSWMLQNAHPLVEPILRELSPSPQLERISFSGFGARIETAFEAIPSAAGYHLT